MDWKENRKKVESNQPKTTKQIPISLRLQNSGLDNVEKEVVEVLLSITMKQAQNLSWSKIV